MYVNIGSDTLSPKFHFLCDTLVDFNFFRPCPCIPMNYLGKSVLLLLLLTFYILHLLVHELLIIVIEEVVLHKQYKDNN